MRRNQLILIAVIASITVGLFVYGNRTSLSNTKIDSASEVSESYNIKDSLASYMSSLNKEELVEIEKRQEFYSSEASDSSSLQIERFWLSRGKPIAAAHQRLQWNKSYKDQAEFTEKTQKGLSYLSLLQNEADRKYLIEEIGTSIKAESDKNPENIELKLLLSNFYVDFSNEIMKGVFLLRDIVQKDSLNLQANLTLGRLSVMSGQYDKAVSRLETVLKVDPNFVEAHYFMGEAFAGMGNKEKSIYHFEIVKSKVDNPDFDREIDMYLDKLSKL